MTMKNYLHWLYMEMHENTCIQNALTSAQVTVTQLKVK